MPTLGVAIAGACTVAGLAGASAPEPPAAAGAPGRFTLVERPSCHPADRPSGSDGEIGQPLTVTVRPTALIGVDALGRVVDAWTNTGCAPRPTDDIYVRSPDGTIRQGDRRLVGHDWAGDFRESGVVVHQPTTG